jgi:hypothetical protein
MSFFKGGRKREATGSNRSHGPVMGGFEYMDQFVEQIGYPQWRVP